MIFLELSDHKAYERLEYRLFDPVSGVYFDAFHNPPKDEKVIKRLIHSPEDEHHVVKKCIKRHKEFWQNSNYMSLNNLLFDTDPQQRLEVGNVIIIDADNTPEKVFMDITSEILA